MKISIQRLTIEENPSLMNRFLYLLFGLLALVCISCSPPNQSEARWIGTYQMSPVGIPTIRKIGPHNIPAPVTVPGTIRYRLRVSQGGRQVRIVFSNEFNTVPMTIVSASIGLASDTLDAQPGSLQPVTFANKPTITLPVGGSVTSDPIKLLVPTLGDLLVSVFVPGGITWIEMNKASKVDPGMVEGINAAFSESWPTDRRVNARPMVSAIEVMAHRPARVVVALGDSITDGTVDPKTGDRGWPGALSRRVVDRGISVVNAGINGNTLLVSGDFSGPAGTARLDRDVFSVPGITHLIVLEGINDIGTGGPDSWFGDVPPLQPEALIEALRQIIKRSHEQRIKVIGGTILPFAGAPYYADEKEQTRLAVNHWIRTSGEFDGIIDFDAALRDPNHPEKLKAEFDAGDHLHPNHAGCREMAKAVDLRLFEY